MKNDFYSQENESEELKDLSKSIKKYRNNKLSLMQGLREVRDHVHKIALEGVKTEQEEKAAMLACAILSAELCMEDAEMMDKTGQLSELLSSSITYDNDLDDMLNNLDI